MQRKITRKTELVATGIAVIPALLMATCIVRVLDYEPAAPEPTATATNSNYVSPKRVAELRRQRSIDEARQRAREAREARRAAQGEPDPCNIPVTAMAGWSAQRITATMQACADQTGYVEDPVDHAAGMIACRTRLRDAGRLLGVQGHGFRWTDTALDVMFTDTSVSGSVVTYSGAALEVQDSDGSWIAAGYECDFDHGTGRIVDVRTE